MSAISAVLEYTGWGIEIFVVSDGPLKVLLSASAKGLQSPKMSPLNAPVLIKSLAIPAVFAVVYGSKFGPMFSRI